jgi:superfamily II DNA/RNA helicase
LIPAWTNGLYEWQLDLVAPVLDGVDIFGITATGDGKSVVFGIPILILLEMNRNPYNYPDLPYRLRPIGIVVTPTKGLSGNIVSSLGIFTISDRNM